VAARTKSWVCGRSLADIVGSNPAGVWMSVSCECFVLSGRGLCGGLIPRPEEFCRVWCVSECDREASIMRRPWTHWGLLPHCKEYYPLSIILFINSLIHHVANHRRYVMLAIHSVVIKPIALSLAYTLGVLYEIVFCIVDLEEQVVVMWGGFLWLRVRVSALLSWTR
jgi:hypothetical protein